MKRLMLLVLSVLLIQVAVARDAWMNIVRKDVSWTRPNTLVIDGYSTYNPAFSDETLNAHGIFYVEAPDCDTWNMFKDFNERKIYEVFSEETNEVVAISLEAYRNGLQFASILNLYFPNVGATTNRNITESYIADFFAAKLITGTINAVDLGYVTMLDRLYNALKDSEYNPSPGTTWDFPFGQLQTTRPKTRRYYIKDAEKVYLD